MKKRCLTPCACTGFDKKENEEAADTIQKVISRYGYTPEFLDLEKQVGAVVSSIQLSRQTNEKSREIETVRKASFVQGVCECVADVGDDHVLAKNLLTEMKFELVAGKVEFRFENKK